MSLIRKHGAVLQAWACLDLVNTLVDGKLSQISCSACLCLVMDFSFAEILSINKI